MINSEYLYLSSFIKNRNLILRMAKRQISSRYKGSVLGIFWSFLNPIIMLLVYSFVFGVVFKTKWGVDTNENFTIVLFTGLIIHAFLAESIVVSPNIILSNVNYVKKIVFPVEILSFIYLSTSFFNFIIGILLIFLGQAILGGGITLMWLYLPLIILPLIFLNLSVLWIFSSLGVYLRDLGQVAPIISTLLLFLCPIFYPLSAMPESFQSVMLLNPLSYLVEQSREILIFGREPNILNLSIYTVVTIFISQLSYGFFIKTKKGFADVL